MKIKLWVGILVGGLLLAAGQLAVSMGNDEEGDDSRDGKTMQSAPVMNGLYARECGSCHFAYQPGFLPATSWKKIMNGLSEHFGDNAELAPKDQEAITAYLEANAADRVSNKRSVKVMRSLKGKEPPMRITEVPYIQRKHREIPSRLIRDNPKVKGLAQCNACHTRADQGSYDENSVIIPGYGRWDD
jgi:hypothetical protein